ncbi:hypothetical protein Tco_1254494 [Tanacetum coccineum]
MDLIHGWDRHAWTVGAGLILHNPEGMNHLPLGFELSQPQSVVRYPIISAPVEPSVGDNDDVTESSVAKGLLRDTCLRKGPRDSGARTTSPCFMSHYNSRIRSTSFRIDHIRQVPRGDNKKADALSKIASTSFAHLSKQVLVEILKNKSISEMEISTYERAILRDYPYTSNFIARARTLITKGLEGKE